MCIGFLKGVVIGGINLYISYLLISSTFGYFATCVCKDNGVSLIVQELSTFTVTCSSIFVQRISDHSNSYCVPYCTSAYTQSSHCAMSHIQANYFNDVFPVNRIITDMSGSKGICTASCGIAYSKGPISVFYVVTLYLTIIQMISELCVQVYVSNKLFTDESMYFRMRFERLVDFLGCCVGTFWFIMSSYVDADPSRQRAMYILGLCLYMETIVIICLDVWLCRHYQVPVSTVFGVCHPPLPQTATASLEEVVHIEDDMLYVIK